MTKKQQNQKSMFSVSKIKILNSSFFDMSIWQPPIRFDCICLKDAYDMFMLICLEFRLILFLVQTLFKILKPQVCNFIKKRLWHRWFMRSFKEHLFYRTPLASGKKIYCLWIPDLLMITMIQNNVIKLVVPHKLYETVENQPNRSLYWLLSLQRLDQRN